MANERLRTAVLTSGLGVDGMARRLGVDRKTLERWIAGRTPYRRHQFALAAALSLDVAYLWPEARSRDEAIALGQAEVLAVYPHRSTMPAEVLTDTLQRAQRHIDILVYAGFWLSEDPAFHRLLTSKSGDGVAIRILLGDPESEEVARRSVDEGIGEGAIPTKIRNVIVNYRRLMALPNIEFRLHRTILYNSIYRADDDMLVNPHVLGVGAYLAPVLHMRKLAGGDLFSMYLDSFEAVWTSAPMAVKADQVA